MMSPGMTATPPQPTGTTTLTFSIAEGVRQSPNLVDEPSGTVYGSLFKTEDVKITGPVDGAEAVASVEVAGVDVINDMESSASWSSEDIEVGSYTFLGFFDVDGNGAGDMSPDAGDPVTLPTTNVIDITDGQDTPLIVTFDLVFN